MRDTRAVILKAAVELLLSDGEARPSVRAIASRAGVGVGTLRHHFPTQAALMDAALGSIYADAMPDFTVSDSTAGAREQLVDRLASLLVSVGEGEIAREVWRRIFRSFVDTPHGGAGYAAMARHTRGRVVSWLKAVSVATPPTDEEYAQHANFLVTVVDGLAVARAIEDPTPDPANERRIIAVAVKAVLASIHEPDRSERDL